MAAATNNSRQPLEGIYLHLEASLGKVLHTEPVSGGCINTCLKLHTLNGPYFLKYNNANTYPGMMAAEMRGLKLLRDANTISIPAVTGQGTIEHTDFLLLEWIAPGKEVKNYWQAFGESLAALHRNTAPHFGLNHDNYIGSLPQNNAPNPSGIEFFIKSRLQPQLHRTINNKKLPNSVTPLFEKIYNKLPNLLPNEPPALLHGDLWEGNFLTGPDGKAWLIDPSVHYGFREAEIAFTQLFGGFDSRFYNAYKSAYPLTYGFRERADIYNLYPLLVHVNLFGGSYANQVMAIINRFV